MQTRNLALAVAYDGTEYQGFQSQPGGETIQDYLQNVLSEVTEAQTIVYGSGRTDAGVHARMQVVNFHTASGIPADRWKFALNRLLPNEIRVCGAAEVEKGFHARKSAIRKTYRYTFHNGRVPDVFDHRFHWHIPVPLNLNEMDKALPVLLGKHDFTSFASSGATVSSFERTIFEARLAREPNRYGEPERVIHLELTGDGFLYNMVRIIAGTLAEIGHGKRNASELADILEARDRARAGVTAPPNGLMLWNVEYEEKLNFA